MGEGRGSATTPIIAVALMSLLAMTEVTMAAEYKVGDCSGWTFNVANWPNGKHFKAGDVLVFKYPLGQHNVVPVNKLSYDTCLSSPLGHSYSSGMDRVTLVRGTNYFICGFPGHCMMGMKIAVNAQ